MMKNRRLTIFAGIGLIAYILIMFFGNSSSGYSLPDYTKSDIFNALDYSAKQLHIPSITEEEAMYVDAVANNSIGRYVDEKQLDQQQLTILEKEVPLYTIEVDTFLKAYQVNPQNGELTSATSINIATDNVEQFVIDQFGAGYELQSEERDNSIFAEWEVKKTFVAETSFDNVSKMVDVYLINNDIVQFDHYGLAENYPLQQVDSTGQMILYIIIFLFLVVMFFIVTIHLIIKLVKKQIEGFIGPLLLTIVAGFGWFYLTNAMGGAISGIGMIEPALMTYLTFATLMIRWKKSKQTVSTKLLSFKKPIWLGLLAAIISLALSESFFFIASFFGAWVSPVLNHGALIQLDVWMLPIFSLFIGLSAAITEESIFRNYMIPSFDRLGVIVSVIATSVLWGILHIGYDMFPWYLYVIDFIIITGPLFYFVYKRYGFKTVIFLHFFYNTWVTTLFLFSVDVKVAFVSLLITLSPFLLFLYRRTDSTV
ncbi:CPBP family intramembrane metalloprotease [Pseudogracilibacillus auburnensis]|nr:CPBP family intramembrane metalloprotease [Pseudogracilibacillus auburnensis]